MASKRPTRKTPAVRSSLTAEEARWRAQEDMRVLREAARIQGDRKRKAAAAKAAAEELKALQKIQKM